MKLIPEVQSALEGIWENADESATEYSRLVAIAEYTQNAVAEKCAEIAERERGKFLEHRMGNHAYGAEAVVLRFREAFSLPLKEESKTDGGKHGTE